MAGTRGRRVSRSGSVTPTLSLRAPGRKSPSARRARIYIFRVINICSDPKGFARQVNEELRRIWERNIGHDPMAQPRLDAIERKMANIRRALEGGFSDSAWANARLRELHAERSASRA